jgi:hypothetical protein
MASNTKNEFIPRWTRQQIDQVLARRVPDTRVQDPLVRFSEVDQGPYRTCEICSAVKTPLGMKLHLAAHRRRGELR